MAYTVANNKRHFLKIKLVWGIGVLGTVMLISIIHIHSELHPLPTAHTPQKKSSVNV